MSDEKLVLVTGATGQQGRAVTEALRAKGHRVRGLVRDPDDAGTEQLRELGAELVEGDNEDRPSLEAAASRVDAMFAMTTPAVGVDVEVQHGQALIDSAKAAQVPHLVYSSVASAHQATGIPHFDSKFEIEEHLRGTDIAATIVAPVWFMNNVAFPWSVADLQKGKFRLALSPDTKLQQVSSRDIGRFVAHVIDQPEPFLGRRIEIAGDELTGPQMAAILSETVGQPVAYEEQSLDEVRSQFEDMATMYEWIHEIGFSADPDGLRREHPEVGWADFKQWASDQDWAAMLAAAPA